MRILGTPRKLHSEISLGKLNKIRRKMLVIVEGVFLPVTCIL